MMRSSPDPSHVRDQSSASAASRPEVSCSTPYTVPSAQRPATEASPRSGPCYSVARIGLPPACRFHRTGGAGGCSVLTHRATVSSAAVPGLVAEWLPVGDLPPRPRHRRPVSGRTGEGLQRPSQSRVGDSSCTGAVPCTEPYCRRGHKTQPASLPASLDRRTAPWGWCWLVGRRPLVPGIMSTSRHRLRHLGARRSEQRRRLEAVSPEPAGPSRQGQPFAGPRLPVPVGRPSPRRRNERHGTVRPPHHRPRIAPPEPSPSAVPAARLTWPWPAG